MLTLVSTELTYISLTAVHIELAPRRREAERFSGSAGELGWKLEPGHGRRIVDVQIVGGSCHDRDRMEIDDTAQYARFKNRMERAAAISPRHTAFLQQA